MSVTTKHPEYNKRKKEWNDCQNFFDGEGAVKRAGKLYLPSAEQQSTSEYKNYLKRAFFFPAVERTIHGYSGAVDRKEPEITLPEKIEYLKNNADGKFLSLRQLSKTLLEFILLKGRFGLLVERPANGGDPYLVAYKAEDIVNWREDENGNLTLVVLEETYYDDTSIFDTTEKTRYRVLQLEDGKYTQKIYKDSVVGTKTEFITNEQDKITPTMSGKPLDFIPFVFGNVSSTSSNTDKPPLLDLVYKNAEHYRVGADYSNALFFTGNPILWVKGVKKPRIHVKPLADGQMPEEQESFHVTVGSNRAVHLPNSEAAMGLTESHGHGVNPSRDRYEDIKKEMANLGARLLEDQRTGVESAETAGLRQSNTNSILFNIVSNTSTAVKKALIYADKWEGGKGEDITFALNHDFIDVQVDSGLFEAMLDALVKSKISYETWFNFLVRGELVKEGRTLEQEQDAIEVEMINNPYLPQIAQGLNAPQPNATATFTTGEDATAGATTEKATEASNY